MYCVLPALVACYMMVPLTSNDMYVQFPDLWILHYRKEFQSGLSVYQS
jgi:hypothetical protein